MEDKIKLKQTCFACPEQYDAFYEDERIGYLRLRNGFFYVDYIEDDSHTRIYERNTKGDGMFETEEREFYLNKAKVLLFKQLIN